ncbi:hypothetical protein CBL_13123 [Carabus blaptoides fortunei]
MFITLRLILTFSSVFVAMGLNSKETNYVIPTDAIDILDTSDIPSTTWLPDTITESEITTPLPLQQRMFPIEELLLY